MQTTGPFLSMFSPLLRAGFCSVKGIVHKMWTSTHHGPQEGLMRVLKMGVGPFEQKFTGPRYPECGLQGGAWPLEGARAGPSKAQHPRQGLGGYLGSVEVWSRLGRKLQMQEWRTGRQLCAVNMGIIHIAKGCKTLVAVQRMDQRVNLCTET